MATASGVLTKTKADTLYEPIGTPVAPGIGTRPTSPTWDNTAKTFTIPASTTVDYYEWQSTGFVLKPAGTHTRATRVGDMETRIQPWPKPGYVVLGPSQFAFLYT